MGYRRRLKKTKNKFGIKSLALLLIASLMFSIPMNFFGISESVTTLDTRAASGNSSSQTGFLGFNSVPVGTNLKINASDVDIRDLLSIIAMNMGVNIVYVGEPKKMTMDAKNVTPKQALQIILAKEALTYMQNGNDLLVGGNEILKSDSFNEQVIVQIRLRYLNAENVVSEVGNLGLDVKWIQSVNDPKYLLLQGTVSSITKAKRIISYLDRNTSGTSAKLQLVKKRLSYVTNDKIIDMASQIGLTAQIVTIDTNNYVLWVKGTTQQVAEVTDLIKKVDLAENRALTTAGMVTKIPLEYVTSTKVAEIIAKVGLDVEIMNTSSDPKSLWVIGTTKAINEVKKLVNQIDTVDNYSPTEISVSSLRSIPLEYITARKFVELATALEAKAKLLIIESDPNTVWASGSVADLEAVEALAATLDVATNSNEITAFVYSLTNISAEEAAKRLDIFQFEDVNTISVQGTISKDLIVLCPSGMEQKVRTSLASIDVAPQKITVPIDYSDILNGDAKLAVRRDLLVSLTGIPVTSFSISSDVSRDDSPHFILYLNETPDNIQKVSDMIKAIDAPLK